tara:strand:- start:7987 stop:9543 length:1557 start_codon:yes stop_codon:yes gene_type:complete
MIFLFAALFSLFAQTEYVSEIDKKMDFQSISLLPVTDNVNFIYANPAENFLRDQLKNNHHWDFSDQTSIGTLLTPNELENNQAEVRRMCDAIQTDTLLAARLVKNPQAMDITMSMFSCYDGLLFAKEQNPSFGKFANKDILKELHRLLDKVLNRVPFHGRVLSRNGIKVTLDLGTNDGIKVDDTVNAIQLIEAKRHPRFHFLISTKKQVLGIIKIRKVDRTISFGVIESEASKNIIQRGSKLDALKFIRYRTENAYNLYEVDEISGRDDAKMVFGNNPSNWKPAAPPTIGAVAVKFGLGTYDYGIALDSGSIEGESSFYPSLQVNGELWLSPEWAVEGTLRQGIVNVDNPLAGSSPDELSITTTKIELRGVYNFLLYDDFFGPKLQLIGGFTNYITAVDGSSPVSLTDTKYSGIHLGFRGSVPFGRKNEFNGGAELAFFLTNDFSESPVTSGGGDDATISSFRFFLDYYWNQNMQLVGDFQIDSLQSDYSGAGSRTNGTATSSDQNSFILSGGVKYLF